MANSQPPEIAFGQQQFETTVTRIHCCHAPDRGAEAIQR